MKMKRKILKIFLIIFPLLTIIFFFEIANISEQRSDNNWLETGIEVSNETVKQKAIDLKNNKLEDISMKQDIYVSEILSALFAISTIITLIFYNKKDEVNTTSPS